MSKLAKKRKSQPTIIPIDSEDKKGLDPKPPQDHPLSMPRGSRVCLLAPPGHGKTSTIKNLLLRSSPFAAVVVISGVAVGSVEPAPRRESRRRCPAAAPSERVLPRVPGGQALAPSGRPWSTGTLAAPLARFLAAGSPRGKTALTPPLS